MDESDKKGKHLSKNALVKTYGKILLTLENCLLTPEKFQSTPSFLDGLDSETETDLRILGCELIQTSGILLKLPQVAMASGQVLFQRFFYSKSFVRHDMEAIAMSCICLASKIEEAPRRIRDVINVFHHIKQMRAQKCISPMILDQNYINLKSQVIKAERRVLKELGFCVHVKHPHKLIVMYLKYLDFNDHQEMMQIAWNFMNDSFRTDVFVRYQPESIACACIYLTARKLNICMPNNPPWFEVFKVSEDDLIDVCYRIMALYRREKPSVEKLESAVDELKKKYQDQRKKDRRNSNTSPSVTVIDRNNGSHNAWGGFISRTLPANDTTTSTTIITGSKLKSENKSNSLTDSNRITSKGYDDTKSRSNSRAKSLSKSRSRSSSRPGHSRSRSPNSNKYNKKNTSNKKRTHSMSSSGGSDNEKRSKKRESKGLERKTTKHYSQRDRTRERSHEDRKRYIKNNGSSRKKSSYSSNDRDKNYGSSGTGNYRYYDKDKYNSSNRNNGNGNRNSRSRDRR